MRKAVLTIITLAPLILSLQGCPVWGSGTEFGCIDTSDCPSGHVCNTSGLCEVTECNTDDQCASTERCSNQLCVPDGNACRTDGDCPAGQLCDDEGQCAPGETGCTIDADCGRPDFVCDFRNTCVPGPVDGGCDDSSDCTGSETCVEGACIQGACTLDSQCGPVGGSARSCVNGECVVVGCGTDGDCPGGTSCDGGFCLPNTNECTTSAACGAGENCVDGRCLTDCQNGNTCAGNELCGADGFCRPNAQPSDFCTDDDGCSGGAVCREGVCRTPCPDGSDSTCQMFDAQLDTCGTDNLCFDSDVMNAECSPTEPCSGGQDCVNGVCRTL